MVVSKGGVLPFCWEQEEREHGEQHARSAVITDTGGRSKERGERRYEDPGLLLGKG